MAEGRWSKFCLFKLVEKRETAAKPVEGMTGEDLMTSTRTAIVGSVGLALLGSGATLGCLNEPEYPPSTTTTTTVVEPLSPEYGCYPAEDQDLTYDIKIVGDQATQGGLERYDPGWMFGDDCTTNNVVPVGTSGYVFATSQQAADDACLWEGLSDGAGAVNLATWGLADYYECSPK